MRNFTTNWALYDSFKFTSNKSEMIESEELTDEIRNKIKLIKKAFK